MEVSAKVPFLTAWRAAKKCLASQENSKDLSYITKNSISVHEAASLVLTPISGLV